MKISLVRIGSLVLCISVAAHAATGGDVTPITVAGKFVDALQHQRFGDASATFAPEAIPDSLATERTLRRISDSVGGLSTMHPIPTLPGGKSIKLEVPMHKATAPEMQKFVQVRYASIAGDGQPVFYEVNVSNTTPPQILSFGVHFPTSDAQSTKRANEHVSAINH